MRSPLLRILAPVVALAGLVTGCSSGEKELETLRAWAAEQSAWATVRQEPSVVLDVAFGMPGHVEVVLTPRAEPVDPARLAVAGDSLTRTKGKLPRITGVPSGPHRFLLSSQAEANAAYRAAERDLLALPQVVVDEARDRSGSYQLAVTAPAADLAAATAAMPDDPVLREARLDVTDVGKLVLKGGDAAGARKAFLAAARLGTEVAVEAGQGWGSASLTVPDAQGVWRARTALVEAWPQVEPRVKGGSLTLTGRAVSEDEVRTVLAALQPFAGASVVLKPGSVDATVPDGAALRAVLPAMASAGRQLTSIAAVGQCAINGTGADVVAKAGLLDACFTDPAWYVPVVDATAQDGAPAGLRLTPRREDDHAANAAALRRHPWSGEIPLVVRLGRSATVFRSTATSRAVAPELVTRAGVQPSDADRALHDAFLAAWDATATS